MMRGGISALILLTQIVVSGSAVMAGPQDESLVRSSVGATLRVAERGASRNESREMAAILSERFDFRAIAADVFEEEWETFTPRQRDLASETFLALSARQFAEGLVGSERVEVTGSEAEGDGRIAVVTTFSVAGRDDQELRWIVADTPRGQRFVDIVFDGRSSVAVFQVLVEELRKKGEPTLEKVLADLRQ